MAGFLPYTEDTEVQPIGGGGVFLPNQPQTPEVTDLSGGMFLPPESDTNPLFGLGGPVSSTQQSIIQYPESSIGQIMLARQHEMMRKMGLEPATADPEDLRGLESIQAQNEAGIAKLATINPEAAQELRDRYEQDESKQDDSFWDNLKDLGGDIAAPALAVGRKALELLSRPAQIIPELLTDEEGDAWYEDIGQALSGKSNKWGDDVIRKFAGEDTPGWVQGLGGFALDVLGDPLTWMTFGAAGASRAAITTTLGKNGLVSSLTKAGVNVSDDILEKIAQRVASKPGLYQRLSNDATDAFVGMSLKGVPKSVMDKAVAESQMLMQAFSRTGLKRGLTKEQYKMWKPILEKRATALGGRQGRQLAGALGGVRVRAGIPFTSLRYTSPALPGTVGWGFSVPRNFMRGMTGFNKMMKASGTNIALRDEMAEEFFTNGWKGVERINPALYGRVMGGMPGVSPFYRLSEQVGKVTSTFSHHSHMLRNTGWAETRAIEAERIGNSDANGFVRQHMLSLAPKVDQRWEKGLNDVQVGKKLRALSTKDRDRQVMHIRYLEEGVDDGLNPAEKEALDLLGVMEEQALYDFQARGGRVPNMRADRRSQTQLNSTDLSKWQQEMGGLDEYNGVEWTMEGDNLEEALSATEYGRAVVLNKVEPGKGQHRLATNRPLIIDEAGPADNTGLIDQARAEAEEAVAALDLQPELFERDIAFEVENKTAEMMAAKLSDEFDSVILKRKDGTTSAYVFPPKMMQENAPAFERAWRIMKHNEEAPTIIDERGYFHRSPTEELRLKSGMKGGEDVDFFTTKLRPEQRRVLEKMSTLEANELLRGNTPGLGRGLKGDAFTLDTLESHRLYMERLGNEIRRMYVETGAEEMARMGKQFSIGGATLTAGYKWKTSGTLTDKVLRSLGREHKKLLEKQAELQEKAAITQEKAIQKMIEEGKFIPRQKVRNIPQVRKAYARVEGVTNEINKVRARYTRGVSDSIPAMVTEQELGTFVPKEGYVSLQSVPGLSGMYAHPYIAKELTHNLTGKGVNPIRRAWRAHLMGPWKRWATLYYPGFHARNFMGAFFNNFLGGVGGEHYWHNINATRAWRNPESAHATAKIPEKVARRYGYSKDFTWSDVAADMHAAGIRSQNSQALADTGYTYEMDIRTRTRPADLKGMKGVRDKAMTPAKWYGRTARDTTEATENLFRGAAYLAGREMTGGDVVGARMFTMMRHGDYEDLTDVEEAIKDLVPFYKWMRTNIPYQIHALMESPGKTLAVDKASRAAFVAQGMDPEKERQRLAPWQREAVQLPLGKRRGNEALKTLSLDLPIADLHTGANDYLSSLLPQIRPFIESHVLGHSIFSGKPLEGKPVPLASWANIPGIRQALSPFITYDTEGNPTISDRVQNNMSAIPIFSRFKNWIFADETAVQRRSSAFASLMFGVRLEQSGEEQLTANEQAFYYDVLKPQIDQLRELGVQLPDKDMIAPEVFEYLGFEAPESETGETATSPLGGTLATSPI